ncbi:MAG: hypothetical protein WBE26_01930, partial [Phycisphaerae bacterium]
MTLPPIRYFSGLRVAGFPASLLLLCGAAGCGIGFAFVPPTTNVSTSDVVDGNRDDSVTSTVGKTSGEPNDAFSQAIVAVFDWDGIARLQGNIAQAGDLDVFLLGASSPGDKVIVDADTTGSALDVSIAIFDDQQRLVYNNDDREGSGDRFLDSYIEWVTRHASRSCYLVVTHSAFAQSVRSTGSYAIDIQVTGGFHVPEPAGQFLLLDFDGAVVDSPALGPMTLEPFNA